MTPTHSFMAAVRYADGSKQKFEVGQVPDDLATVRKIIEDELGNGGMKPKAILIRLDCQP